MLSLNTSVPVAVTSEDNKHACTLLENSKRNITFIPHELY